MQTLDYSDLSYLLILFSNLILLLLQRYTNEKFLDNKYIISYTVCIIFN
jgi:ascorbate-specific PTS system EIIC-type component UlaA